MSADDPRKRRPPKDGVDELRLDAELEELLQRAAEEEMRDALLKAANPVAWAWKQGLRRLP